jgi:hypothetical protein
MSVQPADTVWIVLRDPTGEPEVDVFTTEEAAREHVRRMRIHDDFTWADIRQEVIFGESFLPA